MRWNVAANSIIPERQLWQASVSHQAIMTSSIIQEAVSNQATMAFGSITLKVIMASNVLSSWPTFWRLNVKMNVRQRTKLSGATNSRQSEHVRTNMCPGGNVRQCEDKYIWVACWPSLFLQLRKPSNFLQVLAASSQQCQQLTLSSWT